MFVPVSRPSIITTFLSADACRARFLFCSADAILSRRDVMARGVVNVDRLGRVGMLIKLPGSIFTGRLTARIGVVRAF